MKGQKTRYNKKTLVRIIQSFDPSDLQSYLGAGGYSSFFVNEDFQMHDPNAIQYIYFPRSKRMVLQMVPTKNGRAMHPKYKLDINEDKELFGKGNEYQLFFRNGSIKEMDYLMKPSDLVST